MAAVMKVTVEKVDGTKTYSVLPVTIVAFERQFKMGMGGAFAADAHLEYLYWLAWHSEKVAGGVIKPFDDWLSDVVSVEAEDEDVPLVGTPSPAS